MTTEKIKTALKAAQILKEHNEWRRGGDGEMIDPTKLGLAIDLVVKFIESNPIQGGATR